MESEGKHGKIRLWLDPEASFHPRRIEMEKSGEDLLDGKPVSATRSNIAPNKQLQLEKFFVVVDSVRIEEINGVFVMTGANTTETRIHSGGYVVRASYDFKRSKIDLNPDFNALNAFKIKVPDGTPAYDRDFPAGRFRVFGGEIVPDANAPTLNKCQKAPRS